MSLTRSNFKAVMTRLSTENNLDMSEMYNQIQDIYQSSAPWGSKTAKDLATEKNISVDEIIATGKRGKITLDDVKKAAGIDTVSKDALYPFVSTKAKDLAREHSILNNTKKNFPMKTRTGLNKKTGKKTKITLYDVRRVAGVSTRPVLVFASPHAKELAEKHNIKAEDIIGRTGKGNKIKMSDIENHLQDITEKSDNEESDNEESDNEE